MNFSQQSPKMLKMASKSFFHTFVVVLRSFFFKISRWVPLRLYMRAGSTPQSTAGILLTGTFLTNLN